MNQRLVVKISKPAAGPRGSHPPISKSAGSALSRRLWVGSPRSGQLSHLRYDESQLTAASSL